MPRRPHSRLADDTIDSQDMDQQADVLGSEDDWDGSVAAAGGRGCIADMGGVVILRAPNATAPPSTARASHQDMGAKCRDDRTRDGVFSCTYWAGAKQNGRWQFDQAAERFSRTCWTNTEEDG